VRWLRVMRASIRSLGITSGTMITQDVVGLESVVVVVLVALFGCVFGVDVGVSGFGGSSSFTRQIPTPMLVNVSTSSVSTSWYYYVRTQGLASHTYGGGRESKR